MDAVANGLFVGTLADAGDTEAVRERGIELLVSLTHGRPESGFPTAVTVRRHSMTDGPRNERAAFRAAVNAVRSGLAAETPVLVHCQSGASRSPAVAATAIAVEQGVELETAFEQVAARRDATDPHPALVRQAASVYAEYRES